MHEISLAVSQHIFAISAKIPIYIYIYIYRMQLEGNSNLLNSHYKFISAKNIIKLRKTYINLNSQ